MKMDFFMDGIEEEELEGKKEGRKIWELKKALVVFYLFSARIATIPMLRELVDGRQTGATVRKRMKDLAGAGLVQSQPRDLSGQGVYSYTDRALRRFSRLLPFSPQTANLFGDSNQEHQLAVAKACLGFVARGGLMEKMRRLQGSPWIDGNGHRFRVHGVPKKRWLEPDAIVGGLMPSQAVAFVEVDRASKHVPQLTRDLVGYVHFFRQRFGQGFRAGPLYVTLSEERAEVLRSVFAGLSLSLQHDLPNFRVVLLEEVAEALDALVMAHRSHRPPVGAPRLTPREILAD
jgi:hypothetical protein